LIVGVFIASWAISAVVYRVQRYDEFDAQFSAASK
jgi:hypothetical protein